MNPPAARQTPNAPARLNAGADWWDRSMFWSGDTPSDECPAVIDVTGRTRILLFGPRKRLAAGRWRVTARFVLDHDAGLYPYTLQFDDQVHLAEDTFGPMGPGRYEVTVENGWPDSATVELRLWLLMHAFHGEIRFEGASVERIGDFIGATTDSSRN